MIQMTKEECIEWFKTSPFYHDKHEPFNMAIEALNFSEWVAEEIFDENWELNADAFAELACRKLETLGIVKANGDRWELDTDD